MSSDDSRYWFPAKRYGWGWGLPSTWQGWVVMAAYFALLAGGWFLFFLLFPPMHAMTGFIVYVVVLTIVLTVICWRTGEPPRWRWGGE
jgi:hypothetical protein